MRHESSFSEAEEEQALKIKAIQYRTKYSSLQAHCKANSPKQ
jgi:hypothetical protein